MDICQMVQNASPYLLPLGSKLLAPNVSSRRSISRIGHAYWLKVHFRS